MLQGQPWLPHGGEEGDALCGSATARDPGFVRAQRALLRERNADRGALAAALASQELYPSQGEPQCPQYDELGRRMDAFHLAGERQEGAYDAEGNWIAYEAGAERGDAWLDSLEAPAQGDAESGEGVDDELPYPNEPVLEPPPLQREALLRYKAAIARLLLPGEAAAGALLRLAGAGLLAAKFASKQDAQAFYHERMHTGHTVPPGNLALFDELTEAAEVLFDHGDIDIYSKTREALYQELGQAAQGNGPGGTGLGSRLSLPPSGCEGAGRRAPARHRTPPAAGPAAADEPATGAPAVVAGRARAPLG